MNFDNYDFVNSENFTGKIIITSFPGLNENKIFSMDYFLKELEIFQSNNCSSLTTFVEDKEFDQLCNKKTFVQHVYNNNLKWHHLPIYDFDAPDVIL